MARFQINFTVGTVIHLPKDFEGSYAAAKEFAEAQLEHYPPGTRYHIRIWRSDPLYSGWAPCDEEGFLEC